MNISSQKMWPRYASPCHPRAGTPTSRWIVCGDTVCSRWKICRCRTVSVHSLALSNLMSNRFQRLFHAPSCRASSPWYPSAPVTVSRAEARLTVTGAEGYQGLLARHEGAWNSLWNRFDIKLDSANEWTETVLHLHIFHLLQTVSPHTIHLDVGVPARGWHGEAYRGHIFWDEMFIFPFLNFQRPILAKALLDYRHARLNAARASA